MSIALSRIGCVVLAVLLSSGAFAQSERVYRSWNQPVDPFRIAGNIYYVGANEITAFLITTPQGHIVIDGGFRETAEQIRQNIVKLGFRESDVRILLNSHAHLDHAGGLAELKQATGARLLASAADIPMLARGGLDDPQFGDSLPFPPVYADGIVSDGQRIRLGGTTLTAHITPGHTRGCTSWTTTVREEGRSLDVVFLCSMSVPSEYRLVKNPAYPDAAADYRKHFRFLHSIEPDIFLASHGNFFSLKEKMKILAEGADENPFVDPAGYEHLITVMEDRFEKALAEQYSAADARQ